MVRCKTRNPVAAPFDLAEIVDQTVRLWRKHHLTYDQTKYVVEQARRRLELSPPRQRARTVARLDWPEVQALIQAAYGVRSSYGLLVKTLFYTGARVEEFSHIRVEDLHLEDDPPQLRLTHAKRQFTRYVPIPPSLADELRTHLGQRKVGFLFESNRHTRYAPRTIQSIVKLAALARLVESAKHYLWHGNAERALDRLDDLRDNLLGLEDEGDADYKADEDAQAR